MNYGCPREENDVPEYRVEKALLWSNATRVHFIIKYFKKRKKKKNFFSLSIPAAHVTLLSPHPKHKCRTQNKQTPWISLSCGHFYFDEFSSPTSFKKTKKNHTKKPTYLALTKIDDAVLNEAPRSAAETSPDPAPAWEVQCFINADMHMPKCHWHLHTCLIYLALPSLKGQIDVSNIWNSSQEFLPGSAGRAPPPAAPAAARVRVGDGEIKGVLWFMIKGVLWFVCEEIKGVYGKKSRDKGSVYGKNKYLVIPHTPRIPEWDSTESKNDLGWKEP